MTEKMTNQESVTSGNAHQRRRDDVAGSGGGDIMRGLVLKGSAGMTTLIVALSNSEATMRGLFVALLSLGAVFLISRRTPNKSGGHENGRQTQPLLVRVNQRSQPLYTPATPVRKSLSSGALLAIVTVGGTVCALVVAYVVSVLVESVTSLLR